MKINANIDINGPHRSDNHKCYPTTEGSEIVFRCPLCKDYQRTYNVVTGKITVTGANEIRHHGTHIAPAAQAVPGGICLN